MSEGRRRVSYRDLARSTLPVIEEREPEPENRRRTIIIQERVIRTRPSQQTQSTRFTTSVTRRHRSPSPQPQQSRTHRAVFSNMSSSSKPKAEEGRKTYVDLPPELPKEKSAKKSNKDGVKVKLVKPSSRTRPPLEYNDEAYGSSWDTDLSGSPLYEERSPLDYDSGSRSPDPRLGRFSSDRTTSKSPKPVKHKTLLRKNDVGSYAEPRTGVEPVGTLSRRNSRHKKDEIVYEDRLPTTVSRTAYAPPSSYRDKFKAVSEASKGLHVALDIEKDTAKHNLHAAKQQEARGAALAVELHEVAERLRRTELTNQVLAGRAREAERKLEEERAARRTESERRAEERQALLQQKTWKEIEDAPASPRIRRSNTSFESSSRPTGMIATSSAPFTTGNVGIDAILEAQADVDRQRLEDAGQLPGGARRQTARSNTKYDRPNRDYKYR